jgi:16S rRNA (adenine1518-N6/adenine1519-N6)-dimethyltransferase
LLFDVAADSFLPQPKVDSSVIRLDIRDTPAVQVNDEALMFRAIRASFGQRRKTIANALSAGLAMAKDEAIRALEQAGISPTVRGERLTLEDFARLADVLAAV